MVKLDDTRTKVKMPARTTSSSVPAGGHGPTVLARIVKKAAKRPLKNISSEPSQIITPTANMGGRSWTILPRGAGSSAETAWVTGQFLVDPPSEVPTRWWRRRELWPTTDAQVRGRVGAGTRPPYTRSTGRVP